MGMRNLKFGSCCVVLLLALDMQSLVDVAREEAERRKQLEQKGIHGRVIDGNSAQVSPNGGNVTTSTGTANTPEKASTKTDSTKAQSSLRRYQAALKRLDRAIRQIEERLVSRRNRLQTDKWETLKKGRSSSRIKNSQSRQQTEIEELQEKLNRLRDERLEVYESGKKEGFLPGELEGKGIMP